MVMGAVVDPIMWSSAVTGLRFFSKCGLVECFIAVVLVDGALRVISSAPKMPPPIKSPAITMETGISHALLFC